MRSIRRAGLLTAALTFVLLALGGGMSPAAIVRSASAPASAAIPPGVALPPQAAELTDLRTQFARTYALPDGTFARVESQGSLNYQDSAGVWQPIDDSLVSASAGFVNKANAYSGRLPADLSAPVRFSERGSWVEFQLQGAKGGGTVSGNSAFYRDALPGVDVRYSAGPDLLKESLTLKSRAAVSSFVYSVRTSAGLTAKATAAGGIDFLDRQGKTAVSFLPPVMQDSSAVDGARPTGSTPDSGVSTTASFKLSSSPSGYLVTLTPDAAWLASPARKWPVTVDPSIGGSTLDCTITTAAPTTSQCTATSLYVGYDVSNHAWRGLEPWTFSGFPVNTKVLHADLALHAFSYNGGPISLSAYQQTRAHTINATWNSYDGTNPWTTAGGDYASAADDTSPSVGGATGWFHLYPTKLVQGWINGTIPNDGVVIRESIESGTSWVGFESSDATDGLTPTLTVVWGPRTGEPRQYGFLRQQLSDRLSADANLANGNLIVNATDFKIAGTGLDLSLHMLHNSLAASAWSDTGSGYGWTLSYGPEPKLAVEANGDVHFFSQDDELVAFLINSDGSYTSPTGVDATLVKNGDGSYKLTEHQSGIKWNFNSSGYATSEVDRNGNTINFSYTDCGGNTCIGTITDTQGRAVTISYDTAGLATQMSDSSGRIYRFGYDSNQNLSQITDPTSTSTLFGYDSNHNLTSITDPRDKPITITYDTSGRVSSITRGDGLVQSATTSFSYPSPDSACPSGSVDKSVVTDPDNNQTTYCFDSEMRLTKEIDAKSNSVSTTYNADSNALTTTDALGKNTVNGYDSTNENLLYAQSPLEGTSNRPTYTYGTTGSPYQYLPATFINPQGGTWTYAYDEGASNTNGNLSSQTASGQQPVKFTYNSNGTIATATDAKGNVTSYGYDSEGNRTSIAPPAPLGAVAITYDSLSRISTITDGSGQTRTYSYDYLDRVTQIAYTNGPTLNFSYDGDGNLTYISDPSGAYTYVFDALNRLTEEDQPNSVTITYGYDPASNLTSLTDASGTTSYSYDVDNLVSTITEPGASTPISFNYDANGNRTSVHYPNGVYLCYSHDDAQRLTAVTAQSADCSQTPTPLTKFSSSYNNGSGADTELRQQTTAQYPTESAATSYYCYDGLDRLQSADTSSSSCPNSSAYYRYAYDASGDLTSKTINGTTTSYAYNAANELTNSGFSFDANGNQTQDSGIFSSASYNHLNQTSSITPTGGSAIAQAYASLGQSRRVSAGSTSYIYDRLGLNHEASGTTTYYTRDPNGAILGERQSGNSYYYLFDAIGSVVAATNSSGNVVSTYKYDPYGNSTGTTGSLFNPIRYAGGYLDGAHGSAETLYKFGERYYDPTLGRWTQQDPVDNPFDLQGWNQYKYAGDDPINSMDLTGLCSGQKANSSAGLLDPACYWTALKETFTGRSPAVSGCLAAINPVQHKGPIGLDLLKSFALRRWKGTGVLEASKVAAHAWLRDFPLVTLGTCINGSLTGG